MINSLINKSKNITEIARKSIESVGSQANNAYESINADIDKGIDATKEKINDTQYSISTTIDDVTDSIEDVVESTKSISKGAVKVAKYSTYTLGGAGLIFATITSPIAIPVGILILEALGHGIMNSPKHEKDNPILSKNKKPEYKVERERNQAINGLIKYGKIPKSAVLETKLIKMEIDTVSGYINGEILFGRFKACELKMLTLQELEHIMCAIDDEQSLKILKHYQMYRLNSQD